MTDKTLIHAYVDGELTAEEKAQVEALLAKDDSARSEFLWAKQVKATLMASIQDQGDDEAWEKCRKRIRDLERVRATEGIVTKLRPVLVGAVAITIVAGAYLNRTSGDRLNAASLARTMTASAFATGGRPSNESQASEWVRQTIGVQVVVPAIRGVYPIALDLTHCPDNCRVARVTYSDGANNYYVLIYPNHPLPEGVDISGHPGRHLTRIGRLNAVSWMDGGAVVVFIGPKPASELLKMVLWE